MAHFSVLSLSSMEQSGAETFDTKKMIAEYMENGCLENIIDMFKHDRSLYGLVTDLMTDERMRVRIGTVALLETLHKDDPQNIERAIPLVVRLLKDGNPLTRGDAAYVLGLIGDEKAIPHLEALKNDEDSNVRMIAKEAIEDIQSSRKAG
jgi:hypothetical protein